MIKYFRASPTDFVRKTVNGKTRRKGPGVAGYYLPSRTNFELVPLTAIDQPFVFKEVTQDNQKLTLQGGFVYRVTDAVKVLDLYNYTIDPGTMVYVSEDNQKLPNYILHFVQTKARNIVQENTLEQMLVMGDALPKRIMDELNEAEPIAKVGIALDVVYFIAVTPEPEIAKALEAEYRESLLQKADKAIYSRRAEAVEQERVIQQNEMKTRVEMEQKRKELVDLQGANILQEAEYRARAAKKDFEAFKGMSPADITAHALYEIGKNAARIGNLTITPEILASVLNHHKGCE